MDTLTHPAGTVNLKLFDPTGELAGVEDLRDEGHPVPTFETSEWIDAQASYYRSLGNDLADLVASRLADLAHDWRVLSQGRAISVEEFTAREEVMTELASNPAYL